MGLERGAFISTAGSSRCPPISDLVLVSDRVAVSVIKFLWQALFLVGNKFVSVIKFVSELLATNL